MSAYQGLVARRRCSRQLGEGCDRLVQRPPRGAPWDDAKATFPPAPGLAAHKSASSQPLRKEVLLQIGVTRGEQLVGQLNHAFSETVCLIQEGFDALRIPLGRE